MLPNASPKHVVGNSRSTWSGPSGPSHIHGEKHPFNKPVCDKVVDSHDFITLQVIRVVQKENARRLNFPQPGPPSPPQPPVTRHSPSLATRRPQAVLQSELLRHPRQQRRGAVLVGEVVHAVQHTWQVWWFQICPSCPTTRALEGFPSPMPIPKVCFIPELQNKSCDAKAPLI